MNLTPVEQLVFDGTENDFYVCKIDIECPRCGAHNSFLAQDMVRLVDFDAKTLPKGVERRLKLRRRSSSGSYEDARGLASYAYRLPCSGCGASIVAIAGIGEIQPARFNVVMNGLIFP